MLVGMDETALNCGPASFRPPARKRRQQGGQRGAGVIRRPSCRRPHLQHIVFNAGRRRHDVCKQRLLCPNGRSQRPEA